MRKFKSVNEEELLTLLAVLTREGQRVIVSRPDGFAPWDQRYDIFIIGDIDEVQK